MRAMVLHEGSDRLRLEQVESPCPSAQQLRIKVEACGVCRTDLHVVDGDLTHPSLPLIPGHEIVGRVAQIGGAVSGFKLGQRVGVPWLGRTCGTCRYCIKGQENLCDDPGFTGYTLNGGYAEECVADARYVFALDERADPAALAPLLCAGSIGFRSLRLAGDAQRLGFYGFGAAAHILAQIAVWQGREVYAFTRTGDNAAQAFARKTGAVWAGIHMSDIPSFAYDDLWNERQILSVANLTREDGEAFFPLAQSANVRTQITTYPWEQANAALDDLRQGCLQGAAVLLPPSMRLNAWRG